MGTDPYHTESRATGTFVSTRFGSSDLSRMRTLVAAYVRAAGLTGTAGNDFVVAVNELVANAIRHGGGYGDLDLHRHDGNLSCVVTDYGGPAAIPAIAPPASTQFNGRGLWLARQLTDTLDLRGRPDGLTVTVSTRLPYPPSPQSPWNPGQPRTPPPSPHR
jgi:serine/threonine-protein kinase RsbW